MTCFALHRRDLLQLLMAVIRLLIRRGGWRQASRWARVPMQRATSMTVHQPGAKVLPQSFRAVHVSLRLLTLDTHTGWT
jgi:hypothetical protein